MRAAMKPPATSSCSTAATRNRIEFYRKALALDPELYSARIPARHQSDAPGPGRGGHKRARRLLQQRLSGHAPRRTRLKLMDSYKNFVTFKTDNTILKLHKKEADLLRPYFESEMKRAIATYEEEVQDQARTSGAGGSLSRSRGFRRPHAGHAGPGRSRRYFRILDRHGQPLRPQAGRVPLGITLWHEMSHVFTLSMTNHRVPRWFTEGIAVHEETAVSPEWGDRLGPTRSNAIKDKKLLPVGELDRGFIHPKLPAAGHRQLLPGGARSAISSLKNGAGTQCSP